MQWIRNDKKYDTDTAMLIGGRIKFCKVPSNEASKHIVSNFYKKKRRMLPGRRDKKK